MADLQTLRKEFVEESGRYDLVSDYEGGNYANNGADAIIQAGLKILDSLQETPDSRRDYKFNTTSLQYKQQIANLRFVEEVWAYNSDGRYKLDQLTITEMKNKYEDVPSMLDSGAPLYYSHILRLAPGQNLYANHAAMVAAVAAGTPAFTMDYETALADSDFSHSGIAWNPPADGIYTLTVTGMFWSVLTADDGVCWWSVHYPDLVKLAARAIIEKKYRNFGGYQEFKQMIMDELRGIDLDLVREDINFAGNQRKG